MTSIIIWFSYNLHIRLSPLQQFTLIISIQKGSQVLMKTLRMLDQLNQMRKDKKSILNLKEGE